MKTFGKRDQCLNYWKRTGAYAVIQNEDGEFLCVEDSSGYLFLVGGGIEENESPELALLRECVEETGYEMQIIEFIGEAEKHWVSAKYPNDSQHNIGILYAGKLLKKVANPIETEEMRWVSLNHLEKHIYHEHHLYLIKEYLNK